MKSLIKTYYSSFRLPEGLMGRYAVYRMNGKRHGALAEWALEGLHLPSEPSVADIGCGGGANVTRLLNKFPESKVTGVDISPIAVNKARKVNKDAIALGRCKILGGNAKMLPLLKETHDLITAFETVYYWPSFNECVAEIHRVLKPGGKVLIANETDGIDPEGLKWPKLVGHMHIFTIEELVEYLTEAGFTDIHSRHDEGRHFICVTATKP